MKVNKSQHRSNVWNFTELQRREAHRYVAGDRVRVIGGLLAGQIHRVKDAYETYVILEGSLKRELMGKANLEPVQDNE